MIKLVQMVRRYVSTVNIGLLECCKPMQFGGDRKGYLFICKVQETNKRNPLVGQGERSGDTDMLKLRMVCAESKAAQATSGNGNFVLWTEHWKALTWYWKNTKINHPLLNYIATDTESDVFVCCVAQGTIITCNYFTQRKQSEISFHLRKVHSMIWDASIGASKKRFSCNKTRSSARRKGKSAWRRGCAG